jgi:hypothetical protein
MNQTAYWQHMTINAMGLRGKSLVWGIWCIGPVGNNNPFLSLSLKVFRLNQDLAEAKGMFS